MIYKLTIFTCSYNQPKLLVRAMDSVPRHSNIEYIVIDDGSTDETPDVVMKYMDTHPELNMVFVRNRKNYGLGHGKNIAYSLAQGEYVYQLDHDDYILPEPFVEVMQELDGTDMVYVNLRTNDGRILLTPDTCDLYVAGHTHFIRRALIGNIRTREDVWNEDKYFDMDLKALCPTMKFTEKTVYYYNFPRQDSMFQRATSGKSWKGY